jgi:hypothetical protein
MKKIITTILFAIVYLAANAVVPDSIKRNLEDFDYLTNFTEENYAAFPAIMEQGYQKKIRDASRLWEEWYRTRRPYHPSLSKASHRQHRRVGVVGGRRFENK